MSLISQDKITAFEEAIKNNGDVQKAWNEIKEDLQKLESESFVVSNELKKEAGNYSNFIKAYFDYKAKVDIEKMKNESNYGRKLDWKNTVVKWRTLIVFGIGILVGSLLLAMLIVWLVFTK